MRSVSSDQLFGHIIRHKNSNQTRDLPNMCTTNVAILRRDLNNLPEVYPTSRAFQPAMLAWCTKDIIAITFAGSESAGAC